LNLGVIFGAYAMFILNAGGYALYPLPNHADIETVHEAGQVLNRAFPSSIGFIGPAIFTIGLFIAAVTTLVICVQVIVYLTLDMFRKPWTFSSDNRTFRWLLIVVTLAVGALAPVWTFPAMLKVVLLMGVNVLVIPLVLAAMIYLLNRPVVMGPHTASPLRNSLLVLCLILAIMLAVNSLPDYLAMF
ncbi:MAG: divalent metal cation transporter, partial [Lysobacterales bacterium]